MRAVGVEQLTKDINVTEDVTIVAEVINGMKNGCDCSCWGDLESGSRIAVVYFIMLGRDDRG